MVWGWRRGAWATRALHPPVKGCEALKQWVGSPEHVWPLLVPSLYEPNGPSMFPLTRQTSQSKNKPMLLLSLVCLVWSTVD